MGLRESLPASRSVADALAAWLKSHSRAAALRADGRKEDAQSMLLTAAGQLRAAERLDPGHEDGAWDLRLPGASARSAGLTFRTLRGQLDSIKGFYQDKGVWR